MNKLRVVLEWAELWVRLYVASVVIMVCAEICMAFRLREVYAPPHGLIFLGAIVACATCAWSGTFLVVWLTRTTSWPRP